MSKIFKERATRDKYGFAVANNGLEKYYETTDESFKNSSGVSRVVPNGGKYAPKTKQNRTVSAVDYFRSKDDPLYKDSRNCDDYVKNMSVWNRFGIGANISNTHRKVDDKPLKVLMNSITECKVINAFNEGVQISVSASNRIEKIEIYNQSLLYADCTKLDEVTDNSKYDIHKKNGYKIYDLYKYNFVTNADTVHMTIAVR